MNRCTLILGGHGMLGQAVRYILSKKKEAVVALGKDQCNIVSRVMLQKSIDRYRPQSIINCAAYTRVDAAESDAETAHQINATGVHNLASISQRQGISLMHISTDYVFDGTSDSPYTERDMCRPLGVYGKTKRDGETAAMSENPAAKIIRTQWLYGPKGHNFVETMLRLAQSNVSLNVVTDQLGSPTYTLHLAEALHTLSQTESSGIFHIRNEGFTSWFEFANSIFIQSSLSIDTHPVSSEAFQRPAPRPKNSRLAMHRWKHELNLPPLPHWTEGLREYLAVRNDFK